MVATFGRMRLWEHGLLLFRDQDLLEEAVGGVSLRMFVAYRTRDDGCFFQADQSSRDLKFF